MSAARTELGRMHGGRLADLPFTVRLRDELIAAGRVERHHVLPGSGWATRRIREAGCVALPRDLFRVPRSRKPRAHLDSTASAC